MSSNFKIKNLISVVTPTFNEEKNIKTLVYSVKEEMSKLNYQYEHIIIDNCSTDSTQSIIKEICEKEKNVKAIFNLKNFGHIRSPYYALLQCSGAAAIILVADMQDPPEKISELIKKWEQGFDIVFLKRNQSDEKFFLEFIKKKYYKFISLLSKTKLTTGTTGSGLYDKKIIEIFRNLNDPYPYLRGLPTEFTDKITSVDFHQQLRKYGKSKNKLYDLYDIGILGIIKHSVFPLRVIIFIGFILSLVSFLIAVVYFFLKLIKFQDYQLGIASIAIGLFFFSSIQIFFLGIIGEYINSLFMHIRSLPLVVEKERINFEN